MTTFHLPAFVPNMIWSRVAYKMAHTEMRCGQLFMEMDCYTYQRSCRTCSPGSSKNRQFLNALALNEVKSKRGEPFLGLSNGLTFQSWTWQASNTAIRSYLSCWLISDEAKRVNQLSSNILGMMESKQWLTIIHISTGLRVHTTWTWDYRVARHGHTWPSTYTTLTFNVDNTRIWWVGTCF